MADDEVKPADVPKDHVPVCPYCGTDPATVSCRGPMQMGRMQAMIIFCGNYDCRKIWNVQIMAVEQPKILPAGVPNGFIRPS